MVSGENLTDARASYDEHSRPAVSFKFDSVGARRFGDATSENVGKLFAIVLDNKVISAPRIQTAIRGGSGIITGSFTTQAAQDLALLLRAGALPAPLKIIEERSVGPELGADSIQAGVYSCVVGLVLVVVYMAGAYGLFGLFANIALILNLVLIVAVLSILQVTLTLPGIAGILLTLGMAVDANVLVNERIREETKAGRSALAALDVGYTRAWATILDANLTTIIKMVLLYSFGSGSVKGFAVTITIGILTSMFTAILVVRMIMVAWIRQHRTKLLPV
jgi:protein-export membrane protein SecD